MATQHSNQLPSILVIFAHPNIRHSRANRALLEAAQSIPRVVVRDLYHLYPHGYIDVASEQQALEKADIIVLQHPFYWYSVPALLKEWIDSTLTSGWAFGKNGTALAGKAWVHAISAGGDEKSYSDQSNMTIEQLLLPLEKTASLCKMQWRAPFMVFEADQQTADQLQTHGKAYSAWLNTLFEPINSIAT
jgi:glutathione-regulated potassium-efflux system ancillary protein KefG